MYFELSIAWRASVQQRGRHVLEKSLKQNIASFFDQYKRISRITVTICKVGHGPGRQKLLKLVPFRSEYGQETDAVAVNILTSGNQGVICLLQVPGYSADDLQTLIVHHGSDQEPFSELFGTDSVGLASAVTHSSTPEAAYPALPEGEVEIHIDLPEETVDDGLKVLPPVSLPKLTPYEKLRQAGVDEGDIVRLKTTLATLLARVFQQQGLPDSESLVQVPVSEISKAILEHMDLPHNPSGTYKGTIGSFYASKISLFALKLDNEKDQNCSNLNPDARYRDWLLDCSLIYDFIGGKDQLPHLSREREREVMERKEEKAKGSFVSPVAEVEQALDSHLPDQTILDLVLQTLEGKRDAEQELALARENYLIQQGAIEALEQKLQVAREQLALAEVLVVQAEKKVAEYVIPPDVLKKVLEVKARIDRIVLLAQELGI